MDVLQAGTRDTKSCLNPPETRKSSHPGIHPYPMGRKDRTNRTENSHPQRRRNLRSSLARWRDGTDVEGPEVDEVLRQTLLR